MQQGHPEEHLEYLNLMFESKQFLNPAEAKNFIVKISKKAIQELNKQKTLKSRLRDRLFNGENIKISIGFWDPKNRRHLAPYASYAYLSKKGIRILLEDEWGYTDVVLKEDLPSKLKAWMPCDSSQL